MACVVAGRNYDSGGRDFSRDTVPLKFAFQRERERNGFEEPGVQRALRKDRPGGGWGGLPQVYDCTSTM